LPKKKNILLSACILRSFSHQPAESKPKTVGALNSPAVATVDRSLPGIYPKFPSEPGFSVIHQKTREGERELTLIANKSSINAFYLQKKD